MVFGQDYQKEIFEYWDGQKTLSADPLRLRAELHLESMQTGKSIDDYFDAIDNGLKDDADALAKAARWEAALCLAPIAIKVFNLPEGTHIDYAMGVLNHFYGYLQKKNLRLVWRPTSTTPTVSTPPTPPITATLSASS